MLIDQKSTSPSNENSGGVTLTASNYASLRLDHAANVTAVAKAQKSAYAIRDATNGCPPPATNILGWPRMRLRECIYTEGPKSHQLTGYVILIDVKPEVIATWIETACSQVLPGDGKCFQTVLSCANINSGMMFPVSGNMMENMGGGPWKNYFFRNGMTVSIGFERNGTTHQVLMNRQKELALMSDSKITGIPSGVTRFWRTMPAQFATRFPNEDIPKSLKTSQDRQKWLDIARAEFLSALERPNNRLLEAWSAAHQKTLGAGKCPQKDTDP